jgi:hypothetical protein
MLGPDVVVQEAIGFFRGRLQRPFGVRRKRYFNGLGERAARGRNLLDLPPQIWQ